MKVENEGSDEKSQEKRSKSLLMQLENEESVEKKQEKSTKIKKRKEIFVYGNYRKYYGYRLDRSMEEDPRLKVFKSEWFVDKDCLDIGCNQGLVTISIAQKFLCRSMVGIDIDKGLIEDAKGNLRNAVRRRLNRHTTPKDSISEDVNEKFLSKPQLSDVVDLNSIRFSSSPVDQDHLKRVLFHCENFIEDIHVCPEKYDTVLCLSVTKWIHLNWGDDGVLTLFAKIWRLLKPGGVLLLEPQPWSSYRRKRQVSETARSNFNDIQIHPCLFREILLDKVGFRSADILTEGLSGTVAGFDRPIIVFQK
ncbi:putative RNA methyltransferase [Apostasia shenzhenica]|uniref:RNA methyltransferase n=1 Tax=Apostasia shenzhenica TaxID=1088818 RepID=A0A2I0AKM9_9ASPA|nr:putative RNA methyltransferase [Apostasia shenzhenica]